MSTILIKRGPGVPPDGTLLTGELGWDTANSVLYTGETGLSPIKVIDTNVAGVFSATGGNVAASGTLTAEGITSNIDLTVLGNTTLGDAGTDTLTVNAQGTYSALQNLDGGIAVGTTAFTVSGAGAVVTTSTIDATGNITTLADLSAVNMVLSGDLTVNGTTTTVNSTVTTISDPIITLGETLAVADSKDRGIQFDYGATGSPLTGFFGYDQSLGRFNFVPDSSNTSEVISGLTGDYEIGEIWQNQTAGAYDSAGTPTNASARWNTAATKSESLNVYLYHEPIVTVTNPATVTYTWSYNTSFVQVFHNRLALRPTEYTATNGTSITISYPLEIGDELEFITAGVF